MIQVKAKLKSDAPYSQSRFYDVPKKEREIPKDYEARTWRNRLHYNNDGIVFIPPMALKNCLSEAAKFLSIQIPGKGKATYTKHFEAGIACQNELSLNIHKDQVKGEWLFVPSDGRRGGTTRVQKNFPVIPEWSGEAIFYILDEIITEDVFINHLEKAGQFIGLGRFRPRNNGYYGRFSVEDYKWINE